jgi:hypothetical protein
MSMRKFAVGTAAMVTGLTLVGAPAAFAGQSGGGDGGGNGGHHGHSRSLDGHAWAQTDNCRIRIHLIAKDRHDGNGHQHQRGGGHGDRGTLRWVIKEDGDQVASYRQHAGDEDTFRDSFWGDEGRHYVSVYKNGDRYKTFKVECDDHGDGGGGHHGGHHRKF